MNLKKNFNLSVIFVILSLILTTKGDISDDECSVWKDETTTIASMIDKPTNASKLSNSHTNSSRKLRKKSLILVFDATGSMHDDLVQLRGAAKEIVKHFSAQEENPIQNYILSVFRDPDVEPVLKTKDPLKLLERLEEITIFGGEDCPELALTGIQQAIEVSLPNSHAFVFSDASAKDFGLLEDVKEKIQKKQITVNFLLTGNCGEKTSMGYQVYEKLSQSSGG